jgi:hypothetical protein
MNWEAIGAVGETVGAAGVIASLLFLAFETRKSTKTARASLTNEALIQVALLNDMAVSDPQLRDLFEKSGTPGIPVSDYSDEEWKVLLHFARALFFRIEGMHTLYRQGLIEEDLWRIRMSMTAALLQFPIWKKYWETDKANAMYTPSFIAALDDMKAAAYQAPAFTSRQEQ